MYIVFLGEYIAIKMSYLFRMGVCMGSSIGFASSVFWALVGRWFLVDCTPCRWVRMCPFWVSSDSRKCLLTFFILTKGQDRYLPLRMVLS